MYDALSPVHDETARLEALHACRILDTPPEAAFDRIVNLAARALRMPHAAISFVDCDRQWLKASVGAPDYGTSRALCFCTHTIQLPEILIVPDTTRDQRFAHYPSVNRENGIRFYAGAVLRAKAGGHALGALCVSDELPRDLDLHEQQILRDLAALAVDELTLRAEIDARQRAEESLQVQHQNLRLLHASVEQQVKERTQELTRVNQTLHTEIQRRKRAHRERRRSERRFRQLFNQACDAAAFVHDVDGRIVDVNAIACTSLGYSREELLHLTIPDIETTHTAEGFAFWRQLPVGSTDEFEGCQRRRDGSTFPVEIHLSVLETAEGRHLLASVRDITERKRTEELKRRRAREHAVIAHLGTQALSGVGVGDLLQEAVEKVAATLEVEICRVFESLPEEDAFLVRTSLPETARTNCKILCGEDAAFARHVLRTAQPILVKDASAENRFPLPAAVRLNGARAGICALIGGTHPDAWQFGVLAAATRRERTFTEDDVFFVQSVANVLAAAMLRQRHEDELRVVEARYHRIAGNTPGVVYQYLLRPDGTTAVPFISESCHALYGWTPQEIQHDPRRMLDRMHPEDLPGFLAAISAAKTRLIPLHWEGRHLSSAGEVRWTRVDSRPERLPDGSVICDGIIIDVTEEKNQREALSQSEQRFRQAILCSPFPIMLYAEDGEILQVNHAWTHMTGYLAQEFTTLEAWIQRAYVSTQEQERVRRFVAEMTNYVGAVECPECHVRCASGEMRVWDFSCANLGRLADGRWLYLATAIDVTERRRAETALRTAKEEAERASNAKSEFLSRVSHELRTPLNAILGFGQILELGALEAQEAESTRHILKAGRHLLGLIDEVLDLSRAETGELHLLFDRVDVSQVFHECAGLVAKLGQARGIICRVKLPRRPLTLWTDEQRLRQILLNLLSNAIKYNHPNGQVLVSTEKASPGRLRIKVSDTGPGIAPDALARLFVPFERLGQEHGEVEGTGLGLVVSQRLASALGGSLGVESRVGHGSTFWIELPLPCQEDAPLVAKAPPRRPAHTPVPVPTATLLYVEDNPSNLMVVKMLLAKRRPQWRFLSAAEGASGLAQVRTEKPDLVLLDLQLPGIPGDEVLAQLRLDPLTRHLPVVMLSADANVHSRERLLSQGADEYITKPFRLDHLLDLLDRALRKTRSGADADALGA